MTFRKEAKQFDLSVFLYSPDAAAQQAHVDGGHILPGATMG